MSRQVEAGEEDFDATDFEAEFVDAVGSRCRGLLAQCWTVAFEEMPPVRGFGWSRGRGISRVVVVGDHRSARGV